MLKNIVKQIFASAHTWRPDAKVFLERSKKFGLSSIHLEKLYGGFNELSELYISMFFRSLALSIIGVFVPVFLLRYGYSLQSIFLFFAFFFIFRSFMDIVGGYLIARFGPKHTMVVSYVAQIIASILFVSLPDFNWPLFIPAFFWASANSLFFVAFHVDFSKIKHSEHGGKELGFVHIMERIGATIGPITGGLLAFFLNPKYIFIGAVILLLIGLIPLFKTAEPTKLKQRLDFRNFKIDQHKRDYISYTALTIENTLGLILWPLFLALFALGSHVFLKLGALTSVSILMSVVGTYYIGKKIDQGRGGQILKIGVILNTLIYGVRPFVSSLPSALSVGVINELITVGYRIPYHKAMYDAADDVPGFRIVYLVSMESFASFAKFIVWSLLYLFASLMSDRSVIVLGFMIAAVASLFILTQKFKSLEYVKSSE